MIQNLKRQLAQHQKYRVDLPQFNPSAVLVPLYLKKGEEYLLFTVRNHLVRHHKGEICFPGGRADETDSSLERTALRECEEELGIAPHKIEILGEMDDLITPTFYKISPFVGLLEDIDKIQMNHHEISEVLEIPLKHFLDSKSLEMAYFEYFGESLEFPFYYWNHHRIWGATARILRQLTLMVR
ncbi:MAG: CoA pyrophosphatase [Deltaproteobacteria bacterium]|nr:CoA pyrophosphatase [Deltaproteobacteria bacterium]